MLYPLTVYISNDEKSGNDNYAEGYRQEPVHRTDVRNIKEAIMSYGMH